MVEPTPILDALRGKGYTDDFVDYTVELISHLTRKIPPPTGDRWQPDDIDEIVGDLLVAKQNALFIAIQDMKSDNQVKKWLRTTATNFLYDRGRETLRGRLTRRVERIVTDVDGLAHDKVHLHGSASGAIDPNDTEALLRQTHAVDTTTDWWADEDEDPSPGEREDIIALARCITDAANGPVLLDVVVDVVARRVSLPLRWNLEEIDVETTTLEATQHDIPPANADAAVRLISQLSDNERAALPHFAANPEITVEALGKAIGKSGSTGAVVKKSLKTRLDQFAQDDPNAESALRHIGREILAGRFELIGRFVEGTKEEGHA